MQALLDLIKRLLPNSVLKKIRPVGHGFLAYLAAIRYGFPSGRMIIVGVTGTAGKSTTVQMLAAILNASAMRAGYSTTVGFFDGLEMQLNRAGMSMPGRFRLQRELWEMARSGCKAAIVECTSEGLAQNRHLGINFDLALLTNLSPAHIEAHGSFENYRAAKGRLFAAVSKAAPKKFFSKKAIGFNLDHLDPYFLQFSADEKFGVTSGDAEAALQEKKVSKVFLLRPAAAAAGGESPGEAAAQAGFKLNEQDFYLHLPGKFNMENAALAAAAAFELGISLAQSAAALRNFSGVQGRMQEIQNSKGFRIFVDYAPEPAAMQAALDAVNAMPHSRIVHVFGSTGGHRDIRKRFEFGRISAERADVIVITNDDIYDSDPETIAADIEKGVEQSRPGMRRAAEVRKVLDRREAIKTALRLARPQDIVIFTGKGSEQFLVLPGNQRIDWDEPRVIAEELDK